MNVPVLTDFEAQRVDPAIITNDKPIWEQRLLPDGAQFNKWRQPSISGQNLARAEAYLLQLTQEQQRRAAVATAVLAAPLVEVNETSTRLTVLVSYIPTHWKLAVSLAHQPYVEVTFANFAAFLAGHTFSSLVANTHYRVRARFWNGGTVVSPLNTSGTFDDNFRTAAS